MVKDMEGFYYPEICMDTCNDCRGCEKVCPVINIEKIEIAEHNQECYPNPTHAQPATAIIYLNLLYGYIQTIINNAII